MTEQIDFDEEDLIRKQREERQARIAQLVGKNLALGSTPTNTNRSFSDSDGEPSSSSESSDKNDHSDESDSSDSSQSSHSDSDSSSDLSNSHSEDEMIRNKCKGNLSRSDSRLRSRTQIKHNEADRRTQKRSSCSDEKEKIQIGSNSKVKDWVPKPELKGSNKEYGYEEPKKREKVSIHCSEKEERSMRKRKISPNDSSGHELKRPYSMDEKEMERKKIMEHKAKIAEIKRSNSDRRKDGIYDADYDQRSFDMFAGDEEFKGNDMFADNFDVSI